MSNDFYDQPADLAALTRARSGDINALADSVDTAFDKVPDELKLKRGTVNYAVTGGAADAYTVTLPYVPSGYVDGLLVNAYVHATNTGAATVNVNSLGVKSIKRQNGDTLIAGDLVKFVDIRYSTTTGFFHVHGSTAQSVADASASAAAALASQNASSSSASASAASAAAALASLNDFKGRWYGPLSSDPTLDPLGAAIGIGDAYFNTSSNLLKIYNGATWQASDINTANLAASSGAGMVGTIAAGTGAIATTVQAKLRERLSFADSGVVAIGGDDTARMQSVINDAPDGATIQGRPGDAYRFTNLVTDKSLTLDFCGASLIVNPSNGSLTTGNPAIWFKSTLSTGRAINTMTAFQSFVTMTVLADADNFSVGDFVKLSDDTVTYAWNDLDHDGIPDAGSSAVSTVYVGRSEVKQIVAKDGANILFDSPVEWLYSSAVAAKLYKINNPIKGASVRNIANISETDAGGRWVGADIQSAPHLIKFDYCVTPNVENVRVENWQLHAVNFDHCVQPSVAATFAVGAYRPEYGGHGYLMRFNRCTNGAATNLRGTRLRHVVDFCQAYGCISQNNVGLFSVNTPFVWHGLGEKRCKSIDDQSSGSTVWLASAAGWVVGNEAFNAAYHSSIIRPKYIGGAAAAIIVQTNSEDTYIEGPDIAVVISSVGANTVRGIFITSGAKRTKIMNGGIDMSASGGGVGSNAVLIRDNSAAADTFSLSPSDVEISNVKVIGEAAAVRMLFAQQMSGTLKIQRNNLESLNAACIGIDVAASLSSLYIQNNDLVGSYSQGIKVTPAPTGDYVVSNNNPKSGVYSTSFIGAIEAANRVMLFNGSNAAQDINGPSGIERSQTFSTSGVTRWIMRADSSAETGANVGSLFQLLRRADNGSALGTSIQIVRSNGDMTCADGRFSVAGTFAKPLFLGEYALWVNVTSGKLYKKFGSPGNDTDGTIVGTEA